MLHFIYLLPHNFRVIFQCLAWNETILEVTEKNHAAQASPTLASLMSEVASSTCFATFQKRYVDYIDKRRADGSSKAGNLTGTPVLVNVEYDINVVDDNVAAAQDLNNLPSPDTWTPLLVTNASGSIEKQKYVTPEWGSVRGTLSPVDHQKVIDFGKAGFPSKETFTKDVDEVLKLSGSLSDEDKVLVEYWLACPGSATTPGIWSIFAVWMSQVKGLSSDDQVMLNQKE